MTVRQTRIIDNNGEVKSERLTGMDFLFPDGKGYRMFMNKHSVTGFPDINYPHELSKNDIYLLHMLSREIVGDSCMIGYKSGGRKKAMNEKQMQDFTEIKGRRFTTWLNRMSSLGMIAKVTVELNGSEYVQFYMSPLYFFSGTYLPLNVYLLFQDQIDKHIPNWAKDKYKELINSNEH